jgi:hypothetical protein
MNTFALDPKEPGGTGTIFKVRGIDDMAIRAIRTEAAENLIKSFSLSFVRRTFGAISIYLIMC